MIKPILKLLRPHQYIKNTFVFIGVIFSHQWTMSSLSIALLAFACFSAVASAVYVLNDLVDIEADKAHPTKKNRPLPSGRISKQQAYFLLAVLLVCAFLPLLIMQKWLLAGILLFYFIMNIAYSFYLKHIVLLDIFIISAGFMLRILAGTIGLGIEPSEWLLLCGMMLTLFLGFSKRTSELMQSEQAEQEFKGSTRKVLAEYNYGLLNQLTSICAACTVMSYGLYTVSDATTQLHGTQQLIYTLPLVIYGIFRYLYMTQRHAKGTDTSKDLLTDKHLLITAILWVILTIGILL